MVVGRVALLALGCAALAEAQLGPIPPLGETCSGCKCGKTDLSMYRDREFRTKADSEGYVYMFQMCEEIPYHRLPEGCQQGSPALPHPAAIKVKDNNPLDCELVGSFGPCEDGLDCSMTYLPPSHGKAFSVTWRYQYGCENTFRVYLTGGHQAQPQQSPYNDPDDPYECYWVLNWPSLDAFGANPHNGGDGEGGTHPFARLLLWLFVLFVGYLVVGTAIGVKVQGKPLNVEAVPHIHIWRQVGDLVKSGYVWTKDKVNNGRAAAAQYKGVESSETESLKSSGEVVSYGASDKDDYDTL